MQPAILLLAALVPSLAWSADGRLTDPVKPTAERIDVTIDPDVTGYNGTATIDLEITDVVDQFKLYAEDLTLHEATLTRGKRTWSVELAPAGPSEVAVVAGRKLKPGTYTLKMVFENDFQQAPIGLYRFQVGDKSYVASQFEADEARTAWPAFDEPSFKIPWTLHVTAPDVDKVLSNMPAAQTAKAGGWQDVTFKTTPPLSSYLVALAVGPFVSVTVPGTDVPAKVWTLPGTEDQTAFMVKTMPPVLKALEDWFGSAYPYPKLDWLIVPEFAYGAMENPGLVIGRPQATLIAPGEDSPAREREAVHDISHELAHMWFGDLVTMAWWDDLWLNEAFADWMSDKITTQVRPDLDMPTDVLHSTYRALASDGYGSSRPLRTEVDPDHVFETANLDMAYSKGAAVLAMTEQWLGPDVSQKGLRSYIAAHAKGNATRDDLLAALHDASGKDVAEVLGPFLDKPGAPMLSFEPQADGKLGVHQARYAAHGAEVKDDTTWEVPVTLRYGTADGTATKTFVQKGAEQTLDLGKAATWVYPTVDGVGYFAWQQPEGAERALLADAGTALSPHERLALLMDVGLLTHAAVLRYGEALDLVGALKDEKDPIVLSQLADLYARLHQLAPEDRQDVVARVIDTTFRPALDELGFTPRDGDGAQTLALRARLLGWLGDEGKDAEVISFAHEQTAAFFDDPSKVPPSIVGAVLIVAAKNGDDKLQQALFEEAGAVKDASLRQDLLRAAGSVPGETARERALKYALSPDVLDFMDTVFILTSVFDEESSRDAGLDWQIAHYDELKKRIPPPFQPFMIQAGAGCLVARAKKAEAFFLTPDHEVPGMKHLADKVMEHAKACEAQKKLDAPSVATFLDAWAEAHPADEDQAKDGKSAGN